MNQRVSNAALNRCHAFSACPAVIPLPAVIGTLLLVIAGCASPPGQPVLTGEESVALADRRQLDFQRLRQAREAKLAAVS